MDYRVDYSGAYGWILGGVFNTVRFVSHINPVLTLFKYLIYIRLNLGKYRGKSLVKKSVTKKINE